jgi:DNA processing protein
VVAREGILLAAVRRVLLAHGGEMSELETLALIALLQRDKSRWSDIRIDLEKRSASLILARDTPVELMGDGFQESIDAAGSALRDWEADGIGVASIYSDDYPTQLRSVHDYPPLLFWRGRFDAADENSVAVVGTRNPSKGAQRFIREVIPLIAEDGHPVVSGLARGVDSAAMKASLEVGNRTIGIVGTGIRGTYPPENRDLQEQVAVEHLLLSQFWPDAPPTKVSFPMRNHVMSAFGSMTLIVEAGENSGTRIQARAATRHARPVIITRAVYESTNWAKDLVAKQFDVSVVANAQEAIRAVRAIAARPTETPVWSERALTPAGA